MGKFLTLNIHIVSVLTINVINTGALFPESIRSRQKEHTTLSGSNTLTEFHEFLIQTAQSDVFADKMFIRTLASC